MSELPTTPYALTHACIMFLVQQKASAYPRSEWFSEDLVSVYLRAGEYHWIPETKKFLPAIGIANVTVHPASARRKGAFKRFLAATEAVAKQFEYKVVRLEEVNSLMLKRKLANYGYAPHPSIDGTWVKYIEQGGENETALN